jgi:hypothetical protein
MKAQKPTQTLPAGYKETGQLDFNENRGLGMILTLVGVGLLFGVGWLMSRSLTFLRPAYLSAENILVITGMREFWRGVLLLVVSLGLMIVLNEGIRGILLWIVTHQRPKLGFHGFYTYTSAPSWFIPRNTELVYPTEYCHRHPADAADSYHRGGSCCCAPCSTQPDSRCAAVGIVEHRFGCWGCGNGLVAVPQTKSNLGKG